MPDRVQTPGRADGKINNTTLRDAEHGRGRFNYRRARARLREEIGSRRMKSRDLAQRFGGTDARPVFQLSTAIIHSRHIPDFIHSAGLK